jgi:hypothetical protein
MDGAEFGVGDIGSRCSGEVELRGVAQGFLTPDEYLDVIPSEPSRLNVQGYRS